MLRRLKKLYEENGDYLVIILLLAAVLLACAGVMAYILVNYVFPKL